MSYFIVVDPSTGRETRVRSRYLADLVHSHERGNHHDHRHDVMDSVRSRARPTARRFAEYAEMQNAEDTGPYAQYANYTGRSDPVRNIAPVQGNPSGSSNSSGNLSDLIRALEQRFPQQQAQITNASNRIGLNAHDMLSVIAFLRLHPQYAQYISQFM